MMIQFSSLLKRCLTESTLIALFHRVITTQPSGHRAALWRAGLGIVAALACVSGRLTAQHAAPLDSARWFRVVSTPDSAVLYFDLKTLKATRDSLAGDIVTVWVAVQYARAQHEAGVRFTSVKILDQFDCAGSRLQVLEYAEYNGSQVVESGNIGGWEHVIPGSVAEDLASTVCAFGAHLDTLRRHPLSAPPM